MTQKTIYLHELSLDVDQAVIREWYVQPQQSIDEGQPLLAFETAKTIMEAPMPYQAIIQTLHTQPGETVTPNSALLTVDDS